VGSGLGVEVERISAPELPEQATRSRERISRFIERTLPAAGSEAN
jgi:hypothetical protein